MNTQSAPKRAQGGNTLLSILIVVVLIALAAISGTAAGKAASNDGWEEIKVASFDADTLIATTESGRTLRVLPAIAPAVAVGRTMEVRIDKPLEDDTLKLRRVVNLREVTTKVEEPSKAPKRGLFFGW